MVNVPSRPEIITVNSEELQTLVRDLLPSQNGFGSELQASNVITPIIDLTATAEGSNLREDLQTALAFGSQTAFSVQNATTTILNLTGFFRISGVAQMNAGGGVEVNLNDGVTDKKIAQYAATSSAFYQNVPFDYVVFCAAGESVNVVANASGRYGGSVRQIATGDGTLIQPNGYPL